MLALNQGKDPRKQNSYDFGFDLVMELVRPFIEIRSRNGLSSDITRKIKLVWGETNFPLSIAIGLLTPFPPMSEGSRRCEICKAEIPGQGMKKRKDKLPKQRGQCHGIAVCQQHRFEFCTNCH